MRFYTSFLRSIRPTLRFLFTVNPKGVGYGSPSMVWLFVLCGALILASFIILFWRRRLENPVTRKLSRSWSSACFWFGMIGLLLVVCRVEQIQFLSMRFLWVLWVLCFALYAFFQVRQYRARHYKILPRVKHVDPRDRYLPGGKR